MAVAEHLHLDVARGGDPLFEQDLVVQDVRFIKDRTIYSRIGDLVAWLSLVLTVAALLAAWRFE